MKGTEYIQKSLVRVWFYVSDVELIRINFLDG